MTELSNFFLEVCRNLFNSHELMRVLGQPEYMIAATHPHATDRANLRRVVWFTSLLAACR